MRTKRWKQNGKPTEIAPLRHQEWQQLRTSESATKTLAKFSALTDRQARVSACSALAPLRHPQGHIKFGGTASNSAFASDATFSREPDSGHLFLPECFENGMRIQEGAAADKAFERRFAKEPKAYNG
jgi:hypothetical protein